MGCNLQTIRKLPFPLVSLQERYIVIAPNQTLSVHNSDFRVVHFLGDSLQLELPDGGSKIIHSGDVISFSSSWILRYRALEPGREIRLHVVVIRLDNGLAQAGAKEFRKPGAREWMPFARQLKQKLTGFHYFPQALQKGGGWDLLRILRKGADQAGQESRIKVSGLCLALLSNLLEQDGESEPAGRPIDRGVAAVEHARHVIDEQYHTKLTLSRIAWQVQLSGEHLDRLFKKHAGFTVFDYLHHVRIVKAQQLLAISDLPVVRIAKLCGYSSSNLLGRHFKARTGMTALAYRLKIRGEESYSPSNLHAEYHELPLRQEKA